MKKLISLCFILVIILNCIQPSFALEKINLFSPYAYVYDRTSKVDYYNQKAQDKIYPASMTKMMTLYMAISKLAESNKIVTMKNEYFTGLYEQGASVAGFSVGEKVTYEDLFYGALLPSGADACQALAYLTSGSLYQFVDDMNNQLKKWGLKQTHFENVTGLHDPNHYSTVQEISIILDHALDNEMFRKVFQTRTFQSSNKKHIWNSVLKRGELLGVKSPSIIGAKSGFTDEAQLTMASLIKIDGHELICVTANAFGQYTNRHIKDANTLYDYFNEHYHNVNLVKKGQDYGKSWIQSSFQGFYHYQVLEDFSLLVDKKINEEDIRIEIQVPKTIKSPLEKGDEVGKMRFFYQGECFYTYSLKAIKSIHVSLFEKGIFYGSLLFVIFLFVYLIKRKIKL